MAERNVGGVDVWARLIGGVTLLSTGLFGKHHRGARMIGGFALLSSALTGYCPVNSLLKRNTYVPSSRPKAHEDDVIDEASLESFPASDAPSWAMTAGH